MVLKKWRARRQSIRELRRNSDETHKEYLKLCAQDAQLRLSQPPQYEDVLRGSGVSISSGESGRSRGTSFAGSQGSNLATGMLMEQGSERREGGLR